MLRLLVLGGLLLIGLGATGAAGYLYYQYNLTRDTLTATETTAAAVETDLREQLATTETTLSERETQLAQLEEDLEETKEELRDAERTIKDFEDEYRAAINTVRDLDKLSRIDEELLQQYSRVYFLNENYVPERLAQIDDEWVDESRSDQYFLSAAWPFLEDLLEDAERDGVDLRIVSAYRSFDQQAQLKGQYLQSYGEGSNTFSADQGYSEHQLGTTVDFSTLDLNGQLAGFGSTEAYEWLLDNAYKHGFILSYPKDNNFYVYEPWHWRFVGEDLARDLNRDGRNFYQVPQRELNEYRLGLFD